jgi:hypothetical protein
MTEYTMDKIGECIYSYLLSYPNEPKTIYTIYNDIGEDCPELHNFKNKEINKEIYKTECATLDNKYTFIHRVVIKDRIHLMFSEKKENLIFKKYDTDEYEIDEKEFYEIDHCKNIQRMISNIEEYPDFDPNKLIDTTDNSFHYACRKNNIQLVNNLLNNFDINIKESNKELTNAFDLTTDTAIKFLLLDYRYENKVLEFNIINKDVIKRNEELLKINKDNTCVIRQHKESDNTHNAIHLFCLMVFLLWILYKCNILS